MTGLFDLHGKTALITGASSGLGVQFASALARQGADIAIAARRQEKLAEVQAKIEEIGVQCFPIKCDVTKTEDIKATVAAATEHFGKIDILVNNAGIGKFAPAEEQTDELWETMMATNLNAVYYFCREAGKQMIERKYGKIINIGSIHSTVAMTGLPLSAYCTTKGGVAMLTKALANEWAKHNITINAIGPAYFPSEMTGGVIADEGFLTLVKTYCPMGRTGKDGELDGAVVYFASDASSYTTGQLLSVDGGWTTI